MYLFDFFPNDKKWLLSTWFSHIKYAHIDNDTVTTAHSQKFLISPKRNTVPTEKQFPSPPSLAYTKNYDTFLGVLTLQNSV